MNNINIRLIKEKDLLALAKLYVKSFSNLSITEKWTNAKALFMLKSIYVKQKDLSYLAELDGKIIGAFLTEIKPWWDGNHLFNGELFVDPDLQRKGIGKQLMKKILGVAIKKYKINIFEIITFRNDYQSKWYKKLGLKEEKDLVLMAGDPKKVLSNLNR